MSAHVQKEDLQECSCTNRGSYMSTPVKIEDFTGVFMYY